MPLLKTWAPYFQSHARQHGKANYQQSGVKQVSPENGELIRAEVSCNNRTYTVTFSTDGAGTTAGCNCPQTDSGSYCQHIWATLIAIGHNATPFGQDVDTDLLINPRPPRARKRRPDKKPPRSVEPRWSARLDLVRPMGSEPGRSEPQMPVHYQVCYVLATRSSTQRERLTIELWQRHEAPSGYSRPVRLRINENNVLEIPDPTDRQICAMLLGAQPAIHDLDEQESRGLSPSFTSFTLSLATQRSLLQQMVQTNRCFKDSADLQLLDEDADTLSWDTDVPWVLWLVGERNDKDLVVDLELRRNDRRIQIDEPQLLIGGAEGFIIHNDRIAPFEDQGAYRWASQFRDSAWSQDDTSSITIAEEDISQFLQRLYLLPELPRIDLPQGIGWPEKRLTPIPHLDLFHPTASAEGTLTVSRNQLHADMWFAYGQHRIKPGQSGWFVAGPNFAISNLNDDTKTEEALKDVAPAAELLHRDHTFERQATTALWSLGFRRNTSTAPGAAPLNLPTKLMLHAASELIDQGWVVSTDKQVIRSPEPPVLSVATGIDWFELRGSIGYRTKSGQQNVSLPDILNAARAGQTTVTLDDGSQGMLPERWLFQNGLLTAIGKLSQDHLRYKSTQAVILDSLLSHQKLVDVDEKFKQIRNQLRQFDGVSATDPPSTFQGQLRPYQKEGLGWLCYLQMLTMGGILADDMGLGKTIQVLALLDWNYDQPDGEPLAAASPAINPIQTQVRQPSLIVVPRSIVFNWIDEAQRFAPKLRVQPYTGTDRQSLRNAFIDHDVIVTSYGLMRRDIAELAKHEFWCVVLDEAQTIKNAGSQSAKAAKLLNSCHRLALTGTPVENHLGDLWSILDFLNPGMLGSNTRFAQMVRSASQQAREQLANESNRGSIQSTKDVSLPSKVKGTAQIARALKPFILRRTKQEVLKDLPEKTEQTILCEMEPQQRTTYDQLLRHYRDSLLGRRVIGSTNERLPAEKTMMVLEALLRLRQAACHPGLIDPDRAHESSAKMDVLLDRVQDLIEQDHKALIFSQFTSMLALVRKQLDARGIIYEYLDGKTRNRSETIERFQNDPHCPLFLISLKAGGLGLNLTAAEYVFILDPWWNPAVEAQAIDRAHRIGQTRHVFAYRLICQDTVEQRIAQLQQRKRRLADAIIGGQENVLSSLSREDLQYLLT